MLENEGKEMIVGQAEETGAAACCPSAVTADPKKVVVYVNQVQIHSKDSCDRRVGLVGVGAEDFAGAGEAETVYTDLSALDDGGKSSENLSDISDILPDDQETSEFMIDAALTPPPPPLANTTSSSPTTAITELQLRRPRPSSSPAGGIRAAFPPTAALIAATDNVFPQLSTKRASLPSMRRRASSSGWGRRATAAGSDQLYSLNNEYPQHCNTNPPTATFATNSFPPPMFRLSPAQSALTPEMTDDDRRSIGPNCDHETKQDICAFDNFDLR